MLEAEAFTTFTGLAWVVAFETVHTKLELLVNAGLIPVTVAVDGDPVARATEPLASFRVPVMSVWAHVVVVPQSCAFNSEIVADAAPGSGNVTAVACPKVPAIKALFVADPPI